MSSYHMQILVLYLVGVVSITYCTKSLSLDLIMQDPFECYNMSNIEAGLGLKRKHLIVISLLVGNDHDLNGVQGIGLDTALRFVKSFTEDEVLNRFAC